MNTTPPNTQPLHGGNVYFPVEADAYEYAPSAAGELLAIGGMFAIALLAGFAGVCVALGYGWAHFIYLLQTLVI